MVANTTGARPSSSDVRVRSLAEAEMHIRRLSSIVDQLERDMRDQAQRFDTLQTSLWKRILFRLDGWPGQRDLNAAKPAWRPWRRWWRS